MNLPLLRLPHMTIPLFVYFPVILIRCLPKDLKTDISRLHELTHRTPLDARLSAGGIFLPLQTRIFPGKALPGICKIPYVHGGICTVEPIIGSCGDTGAYIGNSTGALRCTAADIPIRIREGHGSEPIRSGNPISLWNRNEGGRCRSERISDKQRIITHPDAPYQSASLSYPRRN